MPASFPDRSGIVKLASGVISSPVAYLDLTLPLGYKFRLEMLEFRFSVTEFMAMAWSQDGGSTFLADVLNADTYLTAGFQSFFPNANEGTTLSAQNQAFLDAVIAPTGHQNPLPSKVGTNWLIDINPGSNTELASSLNVTSSYSVEEGLWFTNAAVSLNPAAIVPIALARINALRIFPYGNDDANPPTSGETITAGSYTLWGIDP